jgi:hypothetical protein
LENHRDQSRIAPSCPFEDGSLDASDFVNVGYGTHEAVNGPGGLTFPFDGDRWRSVSSYSALNKDVILCTRRTTRTRAAPATATPAGRPLLNGVVIAVVSTGDVPCWSTSVNTRTDTQEAADFLRPYRALR